LAADVVAMLLRELRLEFSRFRLYGLAVGTSDSAGPLRAFAEHAAFASHEHGLFLIPDFPWSAEGLEFFDPSPVVRSIASRTDLWPGMLFWLPDGTAAFAPLADAERLFWELLKSLEAGRNRDGAARVLKAFNAAQDDGGTKRILQLSDLHFGSKQALRNQAYLSMHLRQKLPKVHRVVVTGDLFDNPKEDDALAFRNFRAELEATSGKELIVVPGNHDQKAKGNSFLGIGRKLKELSKLEWSALVVDDDIECAFYCFDSTRDAGNFARGRVDKNQMMEVATMFESKLAAKPALTDYLTVALVHHHPYSFKSEAETVIQKGLKMLGIGEEQFLQMDDADDFLQWCAGRRVRLILHGHKHVARHVEDSIEWKHGAHAGYRPVTAVGCGTSLGAEGMPLAYNLLEWSPKTRKWTAAFFSDPGTGTGFEEEFVAVHSAKSGLDE
jgi:calcineurin-like phosphoesterase family protein